MSNTGFVAGDFICLLINQNSAVDVSVTIDTRSITPNRGNIINALFDGTNWHVWSGGGVFNTSSSAFTSTSFGLSSKIGNIDATAFGTACNASGNGSTAYGRVAEATGTFSTAFGKSTVANTDNTSAFGDRAEASAFSATAIGANTEATGTQSNAFGRYAVANSFARSNVLSAYARSRRYGSTRFHLGTTASISDATNPSQNKEWATWNGTTANNTITEIFLRGVSSNRCVLQAKNVIAFKGQAVAFKSDYTGSAVFNIDGMIKRDGANVTTLVGHTKTKSHSDGTGNTVDLTISADDTNESLRVQVTGNASETWTWLVELELLDLRIA